MTPGWLPLTAASLALAACAPSTLETGLIPAGGFTALQLPGDLFASPDQVMAYYLAPLGRDAPTHHEFADYSGSQADRLLLFSAEGLEDDAVSAQQWRVLLEQTDAGLRVVSAGVRSKCARENSNRWTNTLCP